MSIKWNYVDEISKEIPVDKKVIANVIQLLKDDNTVPFIARYRQNLTGSLDAQKIRKIKEKVDDLKKVENKIASALKLVSKTGQPDKRLEDSILHATDIDVIETLVEPYKVSNRITKVQKAKNLGLESAAVKLLSNESLNLSHLINNSIEGLSSKKEVKQSLTILAADIISKDSENIDKLQNYCSESYDITITSKKSKKIPDSENIDQMKFQEYFDFKFSVKRLPPFKFLALKRGESLKILKLNIDIPLYVKQKFITHCHNRYVGHRNVLYQAGNTKESLDLLGESIELAYDKYLEPRMCTQIKNNLKKVADQASIDSFSSNLKNLLLTPPVKNKIIMGVDPGFIHGCKLAVIDMHGDVLDTDVVYLHGPHNSAHKGMNSIKEYLLKHNCEVIAIGNGVGCRETETLFSNHIKTRFFSPLNILFCITSESGASIYSASDLAASELPSLNVAMRGAVSIARRLQDPLTELIKIDPKNLGVGMYQHDVSEAKLKCSLDGVVENCVSFVGVNVNLCSSNLLQHVAGIGPSLAQKIIKKRSELGQFINRSQILKVEGLGPKKFRQCAGFLRIFTQSGHKQDSSVKSRKRKLADCDDSNEPKNSKAKTLKKNLSKDNDDNEINPLDRTSVHPESYHIAQHLIKEAKLDKQQIGEQTFINGFKSYITTKDVKDLSTRLNSNVETIKQIVESLLQSTESDIRDDFSKPLFKQEVLSIKNLKVGQRVCGRVNNVTDFGAFVDIGVETAGLAHVSAMSGFEVLLNDSVEAEVIRLETDRMRIGLKLIAVSH